MTLIAHAFQRRHVAFKKCLKLILIKFVKTSRSENHWFLLLVSVIVISFIISTTSTISLLPSLLLTFHRKNADFVSRLKEESVGGVN